MKHILVIHQSAELYGSDKTILLFLSHLDKTKYRPVMVLPFEGPLKVELEKNGIEVVIAPVLKLYRKMFTPAGLVGFAKEYKKGMQILDDLHQKYQFDLVYSHTLAALIGIFFSKRRNVKHLWHVQEIIARPKPVNAIFKKLLTWKRNDVAVYDSIQTMKFWADDIPALSKKSHAIWNGLDHDSIPAITHTEVAAIRRDFFKADEQTIVIGLVGRINSWKGQPLLVDAYAKIAAEFPQTRLVFLGSPPPNQDFFLDDLNAQISRLELQSRIEIIPFQQNIWPFWKSIDIAVVPSTEPEPFGMVAIEAMSMEKPVVAANHGGLTEIVLPGETGFLFEPGNPEALASALRQLINDETMRKTMGEKGKHRAEAVFSEKNHVDQFEKLFRELL